MPKNAVFVFGLASWSDYSYTLWQYVIKLIQQTWPKDRIDMCGTFTIIKIDAFYK